MSTWDERKAEATQAWIDHEARLAFIQAETERQDRDIQQNATIGLCSAL